MSFRIAGLDPAPFRTLYGRSDAALAARRAKRVRVDASPGFPDRIELRDLDIGDVAILVNHTHLPAESPYRASHAIFVREGADTPAAFVDEVPGVMLRRLLSVRAFDAHDMMIDADVAPGEESAGLIRKLLADPRAAYLHVHYAKFGCFAARVDRT